MSEVDYDCCDLHETTFVQGDVCPVCEDEMWQWVRDVAEWHVASNTMLIYEEIVLIDGMLYRVTLEEYPDGDLFGELIPEEYSCPEPGVPW